MHRASHALQVSTISAGDVVTVQGERVCRYILVLSGSIGTLNHAAVEHWHSKAHGPLSEMNMLPDDMKKSVADSEFLAGALMELDRRPMTYPKYLHNKEVLRVLAARVALHTQAEEESPPLSHGPIYSWAERERDVSLHDSTRWHKGVMTLNAGCAIGSLHIFCCISL